MKKILAAMAVLFTMTVSVSAADITFTPEGGGKWIFCNNPEAIHNDDLMNSDEYEPAYIMNNENLEPDLYDFLICHINSTDTDDGYGMGFNIELDVELTAVKDCEITINKAFFDTPTDEAFIYGDGTWAKETNKFSCLHGLASYMGVNLTELNGSWLYEAQPYESVTIEIKKGETVWLSDYMDGYTAVKYGKPVQIMGELSVNSGILNFNVAAFKSEGELGDRSDFDPDAAFGAYSYTRTQKGIADSLPKVNVDLEYTITSSMKDGDYFSNKVYNQYQPDGYVTTAWCSNLSPQDDIWSKSISVESDLLALTYEDDSKLDYYGSNVKKKNKNNVWTWDPYHSDTAAYPNSSTWYSADDYEPNYELSVKRNNEGYACSMGNYGVTECYNLKVKNVTNEDKYFEYAAETSSSIAVYVVDEDGVHSGFLKGENNPATKDTMASVLIPANSEKEFSINMVLPINYVGGIRNSFQVYSESNMGKTYEDYLNEPRAAEGPMTTGILASDVEDELPQEVKDIIRGNYDSFELVETDTGYMLRWLEWDGCPYYYTTHWDMVKNIYYLDEDYNIVDRYAFDKLIQLAVYYDGCYYVEDADGLRYKSEDGQNWESYTHRLPLPNITFENSEPSDWAEDEVTRAYALDVAPYQLKDTLVYTDNMTRKTFCDVLASMLELKDMLPEEGDAEFTDSSSTNVLLLGGAGIISGYDDGSFRPQNSITREEAAVLLYKTALYMGYEDLSELLEDLSELLEDLSDSDDDLSENDELSSYVYSDDSDISDWAKEAVYEMNKLQVMSGVGDDEFAPKSNYTNEQSIVTILRLYDAV
ncbi:MAG: S-layer homology domain-containing protein [Oscillospiraceae bacterium]|nr:S-layer homology domain-containing protein [Oscillospiraceae bacterium]